MSRRATAVAGAAVLAWTFGVRLVRGLRWPDDFAEAHCLLDYCFGLVKRGLDRRRRPHDGGGP